MTTLAILGASGHGRVIADAALLSGDWDEVVFYDDDYPSRTQNKIWPIIGNTEDLCVNSDQYEGVVIGIGANSIRKAKHNIILKANLNLVTVIHPKAIVSPLAQIGPGTVVLGGAVVNAFATIGQSSVINTHAVVEHDSMIDNFVHLSPGAKIGGGVKIQELSWLGIGTSVKELVQIGSDIIIGAGSVVIRNLEEPGTYIGIPVKRLEK